MVGLVAIIGVFDKQLVHTKGQDVNETIAVMLVHCGVHDDWLGDVVRLGQLHQLPSEFLPTAVEMIQIASAAHIDNTACVYPLRSVEHHETRGNRLYFAAKHQRRGG